MPPTPAATAPAKDGMVFSGCVEGVPRWPTMRGAAETAAARHRHANAHMAPADPFGRGEKRKINEIQISHVHVRGDNTTWGLKRDIKVF